MGQAYDHNCYTEDHLPGAQYHLRLLSKRVVFLSGQTLMDPASDDML